MSTFPKRLQAARKKKKWNQTKLAAELGVQQAQISHFETGKDEPSDILKKRMAELLDVSLDYLEGRTPDEEGDLSNEALSATFAHRLKVMRTYFQNSQTEFAKKLGISQSALSALESGVTTPSAEVIQKLGRMGFSLNWVVYGTNTPAEKNKVVLEESPTDWEFARIQKLLRQLPHEQLKVVRALLETYIASTAK